MKGMIQTLLKLPRKIKQALMMLFDVITVIDVRIHTCTIHTSVLLLVVVLVCGVLKAKFKFTACCVKPSDSPKTYQGTERA